MKIYTKISAITLLSAPFMVHAQTDAIFYSNGATIGITASGSTTIMAINGKMTLDNATQFTNDGQIEVRNSVNSAPFTNSGDVEIFAASTAQGNGTYMVGQDWYNNANFIANSSEVQMVNGTQKIKGNSITTFHNLTFVTGAVNTQEQHAKIDATGVFKLNTTELATQGNYMQVQNPNAALAMQYSTGFVSSTGQGKLYRATNATNPYEYPVGVAGTLRPVRMTPTAATASEYGVAFVNKDATLDGYSLAINDSANCTLNNKFYHRINKTGAATSANVEINYLTVPDGAWTGISHWSIPQAAKWNSKGQLDASGTYGTYANVMRTGYISLQDSSLNNSDPFVLGIQKPLQPLLAGPPAKCGSEVFLTFIADGTQNNSNYIWTLPAGVSIVGNASNDTIVTNWTGVTTGTVMVSESFGTCISDTAKTLINSFAAPVAAIDTINIGTISDIYSFKDSSKVTSPEVINQWKWTFSDGDANSIVKNPSHIFTHAGSFPVVLVVTTKNGCKDTAMTTITIKEGIKYTNVFSPNGDGSNDIFAFPSIGLDDDYSLQIFDRWGLLIFETTGKNVGWDGRTLAGKSVSDGTYYYVLQAKSANKNYDNKGIITVMK